MDESQHHGGVGRNYRGRLSDWLHASVHRPRRHGAGARACDMASLPQGRGTARAVSWRGGGSTSKAANTHTRREPSIGNRILCKVNSPPVGTSAVSKCSMRSPTVAARLLKTKLLFLAKRKRAKAAAKTNGSTLLLFVHHLFVSGGFC